MNIIKAILIHLGVDPPMNLNDWHQAHAYAVGHGIMMRTLTEAGLVVHWRKQMIYDADHIISYTGAELRGYSTDGGPCE